MSARPHPHDHDSGVGLVPFEEARRRILAPFEALPPVSLPLREAFGCVLAHDVASPRELPPLTSSAMDGYAVRASDVSGASLDAPVVLRIVGRVEMGRKAPEEVKPGTAVAVPTGGQVPPGADAVVPVEVCSARENVVAVMQPTRPGKHVRPAGEDFGSGAVLVQAGRRLAAPDLGLIASAGIAEVPVHPRVRVGTVSTGDELVPPGESLEEGRIYDANGFTLDAAVREAGGVPVALGIVPDDPAALVAALVSAAGDVDVFVSSGGVSVGERDPVKAAFRDAGTVEFLEVAMQPGRPQAQGEVAGRPFLGLPGNPVSVFVSFEVFVRPALMRMMGRISERPEVRATAEEDLTGPAGKTVFTRVRARRTSSGWEAAPTGGRQSNLLGTAARANGLAVLPTGVERLPAGEACRVLLFRDPDEP